MGYLYHGSPNKGIKELQPHQSTHGEYVYATPFEELAVFFAKCCGDDRVYSLYRNEKSDPWNLVELVPGALERMLSNEAYLYTLSDETFVDLHTGFSELCSSKTVPVLKEETIGNLYERVKKYEKEGKFKIYYYPDKPLDMRDYGDKLINDEIKMLNYHNVPVTKAAFNNMIYLHPELIDKINEKLKELNVEERLTKEDLLYALLNAVIATYVFSGYRFTDLGRNQIIKYYPELTNEVERIMNFDKLERKEQLELMAILFRELRKEVNVNIEEFDSPDKSVKDIYVEVLTYVRNKEMSLK